MRLAGDRRGRRHRCSGDAFDLNQDNSVTDDNPDILGGWRITGINNDGSDSDMGAHETQPPPCAANVAGDDSVNVTDLLAVIAAQGSCSSCPEDFWPGPCAGEGDGVVDGHELALIALYWGADCGESFTGGGGGGSAGQEAVAACILAALSSNLTGEAFVEFLLACLEEQGLLD